ncbi:hypothetical protein [Psychroflexus halocasei]|uniref:PD-(D/E)XK nuclease superfamily protein n=1 Tax=Psychroflexus halocasei TaxID=908615 RepID=A0A1H3VEK0_9FLAO|nr:hypothetical protein [Psychroflexus halocasei]SDZ73160.1 hypothetical protein SAMN05421540_10145 [Psychroflexus halocasei]
MNSHLNIFKSYTNTNRTYQLENDLTRALAITLQEDSLFFHEVFREILKGTNLYNHLFESLESETHVNIDIQKKASQISDFDRIFAISLSESEIANFWAQSYNKNYDPICDLVIHINNIILVFEAKRDKVNCTAQLYNQILNITKTENETQDFNKENYGDKITAFDFNWRRIMAIAVKVSSFEKTMNNQNRFLSDFISLVKQHNFRWLPEPSISALQQTNTRAISRRLESAIEEVAKTTGKSKLNYNDRIGLELYKPWAKEILFNINKKGDLHVSVYPGNTKRQGYSLFENNPKFRSSLNILGTEYKTSYSYHIKFTSFQKYFQGLWFSEADLKEPLYTKKNFSKYSGRKKRGNQWEEIATLLDKSLNYDWRKQCDWENSIIGSGKNQFDISFGYQIHIVIPFQKLKELDQKQTELNDLINLITDIHENFNDKLLMRD